MVNLSKFVDKNVRVSYRNGEKSEVIIQYTGFGNYPYRVGGSATYSENGFVYGGSGKKKHPLDIVNIEVSNYGSRIEYLEGRVAILQHEIDAVNAEIAKVKNEKVVIAKDGDWKVEKRGSQAYILLRNCPMIDIEYEAFISLVDQCSDLVNTPD